MITEDIRYIGVNDHDIDLFESQYVVPNGVSYNSYVILDEKVVVMDTVDARKTDEWLANLEEALDGRNVDYIVVSHMEPDHAASLRVLVEKYPEAKVAVHPECKREIVEAADFVGSTSAIIDYVVQSDAKDFIIGTVDGVFAKIKELAPNKELHTIMDVQVCPNMKKVTLEKILDVLENETNEVILNDEFMQKALSPLEKMLELAK